MKQNNYAMLWDTLDYYDAKCNAKSLPANTDHLQLYNITTFQLTLLFKFLAI